MITQAYSVAFEGTEARLIEVQCALSAGSPAFSLVGLPDKAVSEARLRVQSALQSLSIALPAKRITLNLAPADLPKEGSHFDLPIALAMLAALGGLEREAVEGIVALGELSLDGRLRPVAGVLPAALAAAASGRHLLCPHENGPEAAWVAEAKVIAARNLLEVLQHLGGQRLIGETAPQLAPSPSAALDLREIKGQERAKRALEIAASGRHHLLMIGPPGSGKSMLAKRLPGIMPLLHPLEALETSLIHSIAGLTLRGGISQCRPFRDPHHSATQAALIGGGRQAKPGELSLAHNGVLFLDELPEFSRQSLETLRQPLESGEVSLARANAHIRYKCRVLLVAAANPCRCGHLSDPARACARAPLCGQEYLAKISGPLMDRFDLRLEVPPVAFTDLDRPSEGESSATIAARVARARALQEARLGPLASNADLAGAALERFATPDAEGRMLINRLAEKFGLSARGYHRILRLGRTIADMEGSDQVKARHIAEAFSYRLVGAPQA